MTENTVPATVIIELLIAEITGVFRTATHILLGPDEAILHVAVADATGWRG